MRGSAPDRVARAAPRRWRGLAVWALGTALIVGLAAASIAITTPTLAVALWWPASGAAACLALVVPRRSRPAVALVVFAATTLGNLVAGRPPVLALAFGAVNALEIALFLWVLLHGRTDARLRTTADSLRLAVAATVSSVALGLAAGGITAAAGTADFVSTAVLTAASHLSAILLTTPLVLLAPRPRQAFDRRELVVQIFVAALALIIGFGPLADFRLGFLVFLPLVWAALRFPPLIAHIEALLIAVGVLAVVAANWREYVVPDIDVSAMAISIVAFLCAISILTVAIVAGRGESLENAQRALDAAEARAEAARATAATLRVRYDLDRQREDFLSTTSHELRTPVTVIAGYADLLGDHAELPDETRAWVDAIHRNTGRLAGMLDDLLAFTRSGSTRPVLVDVDVAHLVSCAVDVHSGAAARKGITVTIARTRDLTVRADLTHAQRALSSLLSNAVKFTPPSGRIGIDAVAVGGDVMITVSDTGTGMAPDTLAQAFEPFYRGEQAEVRAMPGTGLGLAIARMLARRNDGEVTLVSRPGQGTKATLLLRRSDDGESGR